MAQNLPGATLPGAQLPGAQLPGAQLPGAQLPGAQLPGAQLLGAQELQQLPQQGQAPQLPRGSSFPGMLGGMPAPLPGMAPPQQQPLTRGGSVGSFPELQQQQLLPPQPQQAVSAPNLALTPTSPSPSP